ncbi:MAG: type II toxin-antitoxin system death-on-curing family toxin [Sulfurimonas sp.]|nr:type II toxin-antitoxin system death-on-curing family toxin [Sulfurimonas sp.]
MIDISDVIKIHKLLIVKYGGLEGIRDKGLLDSSINRPFQTFSKNELYPSVIDKASVLIESIVKNHPFVDGNKRVGLYLCLVFLQQNGYKIDATDNEKYDFVILIAESKINFENIKTWIYSHTKIHTKS